MHNLFNIKFYLKNIPTCFDAPVQHIRNFLCHCIWYNHDSSNRFKNCTILLYFIV